MSEHDLPNSEITIFLSSLVINTIMVAILFVVLGGRKLLSQRVDPAEPADDRRPGGPAAGVGGAGAAQLVTGQPAFAT